MTHARAPRLRSDLSTLPRYVAGRTPHGTGWKLSSNEVAVPPTAAVRAAAGVPLRSANRYPDIAATGLVTRLADHLRVEPERILLGGGSIAVLQEVLQTVTDPGDAVVFAWRSYEAYPIVTRVSRATPIEVPLTLDHRHDLTAMADAVRRHEARVVIVCNPNNPTGTAVSRGELEEFIDAVPSGCLVILDEAYREFVTDDTIPDGLELSMGRPNTLVLRTFSKAHGLAGLRVGYAVAPPAIADAVRAVALPFTVSSVAQVAAVAALDDWGTRREAVRDVTLRRDALAAALRCGGLEVAPSQANFVWLPWSPVVEGLVQTWSDLGISVRAFGQDGVRLTVGEPDALAAIVSALPAGTVR